ncbi:MAG: FAD-binding oxidoreductase [Clostridiales Family XIII bacterium]|jgi:glycolate oxidase|nr:FAD-binding oxidoreductase [Clostridiales Family XIII bacterium]
MALEREAYRAIEDIVGKRNVSEDSSVTETYRCITSQSSAHYGPFNHQTPRPQAVVLPGSTEEVRQVIRICNRYGIQFKVASTFWAAMGYVGSDRAIQIDMVRMGGVRIDAKNMMAIVEPYAIGAVVQVEAMKFGLNCNMAGVGCSSSVLAGAAGWMGFGPSSLFMGIASENILGAEWVLPDGEILRTGSLGSDGSWFCGEGPGPSTRAVLRGWQGSTGAMGVCTRMAVRLHPWPGPKLIPTYGEVPSYKADGLENFRTYTLCFNEWEDYARAFQLFHEADVIYLGHRQFNMFGRDIKGAMLKILVDSGGQFSDLLPLMDDPYVKSENEKMKIDVQIVLAGLTERDLAYKEKAVDEVLRQTHGWKSEFMLDKEMRDFVLLYLLRLGRKNLNYTLCSSYEGNFGMSSNVFVAAPLMEEASALKRKWEQDTPHIAAVGGDSDMGSMSGIGGGGTTGWEFFVHFDAYDKDSIRGTKEFIDDSQRWMLSKGLGADMGRWNADARREDGYDYTQEEHDAIYKNLPQPAIFEYQWKVREAFNPRHLTGSYYRTKTPENVK